MVYRDKNVIRLTEVGDSIDETICVQSINYHDVSVAFGKVVINEKADGSGNQHFTIETRLGNSNCLTFPITPIWCHGGFKVMEMGSGEVTVYASVLSKKDLDEVV